MNATRFAFVAAGGSWTGTRLDGLEVRADGRVELARTSAGRRATGTLETGPLDAGEDGRWSRVAVEADVPPGTGVALATFAAADAGATPVWAPAPSHDLLVAAERFLWLRLTLERAQPSGDSTPVVSEARAETESDSYLDHLPLVYAREDTTGFLRRLLALARSSLGDLEGTIDLLARRFNTATAPPGTLAWLAGWQAFDPPPGAGPDSLRALLAGLPQLYEQRGTPRGVIRLVEAQTGVRPALFEHFRHRGRWILDTVGALGVDTALAGSAPEGIVLDASLAGTSAPEDPAEPGRMVFGDTAHRFTAVVPAGALGARQRRRVAAVLEAEKPAHTSHHLCFAEPRFRLGVQDTLGVDTIVGRSAPGIRLG